MTKGPGFLVVLLIVLVYTLDPVNAFQTSLYVPTTSRLDTALNDFDWKGEIVPGDGTIQGCSVQQDSVTSWTVQIDGVEADLARFSQAIHKKITDDAKRQRFQGFRPGTIPPHLQRTYRAFAMDECARETVLEAMQQNEIRPFDSTRAEMELGDFSIPPPKRKSKKKSKKKPILGDDSVPEMDDNSWKTYATMNEAIDAGWQPGQSFSFRAYEVKGQKVQVVPGGPA